MVAVSPCPPLPLFLALSLPFPLSWPLPGSLATGSAAVATVPSPSVIVTLEPGAIGPVGCTSMTRLARSAVLGAVLVTTVKPAAVSAARASASVRPR